ncbi:hypothetical protein L208DRAFT_1281668 [Tricholoma matsutake]|nr:hypothetical protein L208DRAFT_1281668 [Tricholoma matsutake 945]
MYHNKCFQCDPNFPFVAFSHKQIKVCLQSSFLAVNKRNFDSIANHVLSVNPDMLESLAKQMSNGEIVCPESEEEKKCFRLISDIDCIGRKIPGMISCKKDQRNEIWSLTYSKGVLKLNPKIHAACMR